MFLTKSIYKRTASILRTEEAGERRPETVFRYNPRAKKYIIRVKAEGVFVTIPYGGNLSYAEQFFKKNEATIRQQWEKYQEKNISKTSLSPQQDRDLRCEAQRILPLLLERLAREHGFQYVSVRIRKSRTRWGSCSSRKTISLSLYLMLLPSHLIEYVLLHELCHTVHMNHSADFWALLDRHTQGQSQALRRELKNFNRS
ncbi:MAG: M48 family metallopeptidase [Dysgonamonadaceae bacterium]|jgi:predicted metal-dependent hydrolase|nr:M48 family metallopeptidase [Dysgonamonadaceae bacterium]